jgi:hypothetical protein
MAWFKVDDGFYTSTKFLMIPRHYQVQAAGAWLLAGTWSADKMTDGFVPYAVMDLWDFDAEVVGELVANGLWDHDEERDGIHFHDWSDYQPTREQLEARNAEKHAKKVAAGIKSGEARRAKSEQNRTPVEQNRTESEQNLNPEPEPVPHKNTSSPKAMAFDEFWGIWPRKEGKANAVKAYEKALKRIGEPELLEKVRAYVSSPARPDVKFVPHAATWLNGERWLDDFAPAKPDIDPDWWMYPQESVSV